MQAWKVNAFIICYRTGTLKGIGYGTTGVRRIFSVRGVRGSVVEPEPDFFAGAGAGEMEPAPACCYMI